MRTRAVRRFLLCALATLALAGGFTGASATLPRCARPVITNLDGSFEQGHEFILGWEQDQADPNKISTSFKIQVASSGQPVFPSEDFVDEEFTTQVGSSAQDPQTPGLWRTIIGDTEAESLTEDTHWYHVKGLARTNKCIESFWSAPLMITQDATGPVVTIDTANMSVFTLEPVVIEGTAVDDPGGDAEIGSGASSVRVEISNTTPVAGPMLGRPPAQEVPVDPETGTWIASFPMMQPGTYSVRAVGRDAVDNLSDDAAEIGIIVVVNLPS